MKNGKPRGCGNSRKDGDKRCKTNQMPGCRQEKILVMFLKFTDVVVQINNNDFVPEYGYND